MTAFTKKAFVCFLKISEAAKFPQNQLTFRFRSRKAADRMNSIRLMAIVTPEAAVTRSRLGPTGAHYHVRHTITKPINETHTHLCDSSENSADQLGSKLSSLRCQSQNHTNPELRLAKCDNGMELLLGFMPP